MLRIGIDYAIPGMKLALPVRHPRRADQVLVSSGYELAASDVARLSKVGVTTLWIDYHGLEFLSKYVKQDVLAAQDPVIELSSSIFSDALRSKSFKLSNKQSWQPLAELVEALITNPRAALFMGHMGHDMLDALVQRSCTVAYLSLLMGLKLEGYLVDQRPHIDPSRAKELINLGIGALLHDLGVTQLDPQVRNAYNKTGDQADKKWQQHTVLGYRMVRQAVAPSAAIIALNHHQLMDGTGYTGEGFVKLEGHRIHVFSRIVAVVDQFVNLCVPPGSPKRPTVWALSELGRPEMSERYDPNVLRALFTVVPPYPPGSIVRLSDGQQAVCVEHIPNDPCRPVVQVIGESGKIDPTRDEPLGPVIKLEEVGPTLYVTECDGVDVSEMNFRSPEVMRDPYHHIAYL